jgi:predicted metal-binding membrane protein
MAGTLAHLISRPQALTLITMMAISILCWIYLLVLGQHMAMRGEMNAHAAMPFTPRTLTDLLLMLVMWWVMMIGMMTPSATPMILIFDRINKTRQQRGQPFVATAVFVVGYLGIWGAFSVLATLAQWALESAALMLPMRHLNSPLFCAAVLISAGAYQFSSMKYACLKHCRSPLSFVMNRWRDGARGALKMGAWHGSYCLGCCWLLMALLFVGGVMNLLWVAAIAVFVLLEKLFPAGQWLARSAGVLMLGSGAWLLLRGI